VAPEAEDNQSKEEAISYTALSPKQQRQRLTELVTVLLPFSGILAQVGGATTASTSITPFLV
jgi:hypothetical protein